MNLTVPMPAQSASCSCHSSGEGFHGVSSVRLNGKDLGVRWWGRHLYDATGALAHGRNVLEVEVTTTLGNRMRSLKDNPVAKSWSWWFPPSSMGLVGPVQLMKPVD